MEKFLVYCTKDPKRPLWKRDGGFCCEKIPYDIDDICVNGKIIGSFDCENVDKLEPEFYAEEPLYKDYGTYQALKRVCLEQLDLVDYDEDWCDRDTLYCNEDYLNEEDEKKNEFLRKTCLSGRELQKYFNRVDIAYAIHIINAKAFEKPLTIEALYQPIDNNFCKGCKEYNTCDYAKSKNKPCKKVLLHAPQNMCRVWYNGEIYTLISIRPQWCEKIFSGEKSIEVRTKILKVLEELMR